MTFLFIFIIILSVYEIHYIIKNANDIKTPLIILYCFIAIISLLIGVYYYVNQFGNSISYYIFKILNIKY